jgi:hypothetical protein
LLYGEVNYAGSFAIFNRLISLSANYAIFNLI